MKALLTHSRLRAARACQRLHHITYQLGYRPAIEAESLRFGSLFHRGLRAFFEARRGLGMEGALAAALNAVSTEADPFDRVRAEVLLHGYAYRWADEPYEVLAVEAEFRTELRNPATGASSRTWNLGGAIDVIVRDRRDGRIAIMEHKTTSEDIRPGSEYWRRLRMDGQVSMYFEGGRALGHDISECIYDVIGKPSIRPLKATPLEDRKYTKATKTEPSRLYATQREADETPDEFRARLVESIASDPAGYFQRGSVVRLEQEMEDALFDIWQLGQQIRESEVAQRAPRNPDACVRYGRTCPFFDVCTGAASLEDATRYERSEVTHPELPGLMAQASETEQPNQQEAV